MWKKYIFPENLAEAAEILAGSDGKARVIAGGTDLVLEIKRKQRKDVETLVDISRVQGADEIREENGKLHLGVMVTHNDAAASSLVQEKAGMLAEACWQVGAPQIRNRGTIAGNLITASPANDTISPLMALDAELVLLSTRGRRTVRIAEFYTGVRKTVMAPDEVLEEIIIPVMKETQTGAFYKLGLRRAQAISVVNAAVWLEMDGETIKEARITLGSVAPTIIHAEEAEKFLAGKKLTDEHVLEAAQLAEEAAAPIDDLRGSAAYRNHAVQICVQRALLAARTGKLQVPENPVVLKTVVEKSSITPSSYDGTIQTRINGVEYHFEVGQQKILLDLLRDEAMLIGSKEGCGEGECGACTLFLDGAAVMGCLVPAPRAHGADIVTIEGLQDEDGGLHIVQEAFIEENAVQCGYCTPGFIMSAAKLLEEKVHPDQQEIKTAITGNLCRCTGYYNIIKAIESAAEKETGR